MVLAMRHGVVPRSLHIDEPSPHVDWSAGAVRLASETTVWPEVDRPRRAGVSSFGVSGTNAHVVLEQSPEPEPVSDGPESGPGLGPELGPTVWVVSARSAAGLRAQVDRLASFVQARPELPPGMVAAGLVRRRALLPYRAVGVGATAGELIAGLRTAPDPAAAAAGGGVVWVFAGQGWQWQGMGRQLMTESVVFAEAMAECDAALRPWTGRSVLDDHDGDVRVVQPLMWAVMVSLSRVWRSLGVYPSAVIGHSQGELAAAVAAGALSLAEGARIVAVRAAVIAETLSGRGGMLSVALPETRVRELVDGVPGVDVAAVNGPGLCVVSGDRAAVESIDWGQARTRWVDVDYASHSVQVETAEELLSQRLGVVEFQAGQVPWYSTVTGELIDPAGLDAGYWFTNLRAEVRFEAAVRAAVRDGRDRFLEVSGHPVLLPGITTTLGDIPAVVSGTLQRDRGGLIEVLRAAAVLHTAGIPINWEPILPATDRQVDLPTYAFQHQRYWLDPAGDGGWRGSAVRLADGGVVVSATVSLARQPWLADHAVN
ncbi:acyltransferase domain-containing protein, partial [Micromonospora eburnea]|uniref:acyltransferase domain-containing protein n=1 Tax=Micromonospora eburnea TaxID=227316 RepID=UPI003635DB66